MAGKIWKNPDHLWGWCIGLIGKKRGKPIGCWRLCCVVCFDWTKERGGANQISVVVVVVTLCIWCFVGVKFRFWGLLLGHGFVLVFCCSVVFSWVMFESPRLLLWPWPSWMFHVEVGVICCGCVASRWSWLGKNWKNPDHFLSWCVGLIGKKEGGKTNQVLGVVLIGKGERVVQSSNLLLFLLCYVGDSLVGIHYKIMVVWWEFVV